MIINMYNFIFLKDSQQLPLENYRNNFVLIFDYWDDFGYKTTFNMIFYDDNGNPFEIGIVKIYNKCNKNTKDYILNNQSIVELYTLDDYCCSLGQDYDYYKKLKTYFHDNYLDILKRLKDIAIFEEIRKNNIGELGINNSLLRNSSAERLLYELKDLIKNNQNQNSNTNFQDDFDASFGYKVQLPYDLSPQTLKFDFKKQLYLPYRINVIIGKNGAGKTSILTHLANSLSGYGNNFTKEQFLGQKRPLLNKVIAVSYSAFDNFERLPDNLKQGITSYIYCGIKDEQNNTMSLEKLKKLFSLRLNNLKYSGKFSFWLELISQLLETTNEDIEQLIKTNYIQETVFSSGHQLLICAITGILDFIGIGSIILYDEPELHLHPNAISKLMFCLNKILDKYKSYAILATHSPLILQEIPSRYVQVINRQLDFASIKKLNNECLGNNISDIITEVFSVNYLDSNYKHVLKHISDLLSWDEALKLFDNKLSFNALFFLKSCYNSDKEK